MLNRLRCTLATLVSLSIGADLAVAQDFSVPPAPRRLEIGVFRQDHDRTFHYPGGYEQDGRFDRVGIHVRVRIAPGLALEGSGGTWDVGGSPQFPDRDYIQYSLGAGITAIPIHLAGFDLGTSIHYLRIADVDRSIDRYDKLHRQWGATVGAGRTFALGGSSVALWAGPVYVMDWLDQFPPTNPAAHARSVNNLGGVGIASVTFKGRLRFTGRMTLLDKRQTQFGAALLL